MEKVAAVAGIVFGALMLGVTMFALHGVHDHVRAALELGAFGVMAASAAHLL